MVVSLAPEVFEVSVQVYELKESTYFLFDSVQIALLGFSQLTYTQVLGHLGFIFRGKALHDSII